MTYGRVHFAALVRPICGRKSSAELVRGNLYVHEGPLIRSFGHLLPKGRRDAELVTEKERD